jgi:hypothetical protein
MLAPRATISNIRPRTRPFAFDGIKSIIAIMGMRPHKGHPLKLLTTADRLINGTDIKRVLKNIFAHILSFAEIIVYMGWKLRFHPIYTTLFYG